MARQKSVNGSKKILKALNTLMKDLDKKVSIRVGIIGEQAYETHPHTDLTMAHLGAIHEFGATIQHPGGTPYTIDENGLAHFVSKDKGEGLPKTKPHTITIPARSFLRATLLSGEGKKRLMDLSYLSDNPEMNKALYQDYKIFMRLCNIIGANALAMVKGGADEKTQRPIIGAFEVGGWPDKWQPISEVTKKNRIADPHNPPLQDTGDLMDSISVEVKEVR